TANDDAAISGIHWLADTRQVVASAGLLLNTWNSDDGSLIQSIRTPHIGAVRTFGVSPDGTRLVSNGTGLPGHPDDTIRVWNTEDGAQLGSFTQPFSFAVRFSVDGSQIVVGSFSFMSSSLMFFDADTYALLHTTPLDGIIYTFDLSPDGSLLAGVTAVDETARIVEVNTGESVRTFFGEGHLGSIRALSLSPDGSILATLEN